VHADAAAWFLHTEWYQRADRRVVRYPLAAAPTHVLLVPRVVRPTRHEVLLLFARPMRAAIVAIDGGAGAGEPRECALADDDTRRFFATHGEGVDMGPPGEQAHEDAVLFLDLKDRLLYRLALAAPAGAAGDDAASLRLSVAPVPWALPPLPATARACVVLCGDLYVAARGWMELVGVTHHRCEVAGARGSSRVVAVDGAFLLVQPEARALVVGNAHGWCQMYPCGSSPATVGRLGASGSVDCDADGHTLVGGAWEALHDSGVPRDRVVAALRHTDTIGRWPPGLPDLVADYLTFHASSFVLVGHCGAGSLRLWRVTVPSEPFE
jgi:hypothetical protein